MDVPNRLWDDGVPYVCETGNIIITHPSIIKEEPRLSTLLVKPQTFLNIWISDFMIGLPSEATLDLEMQN